MNNQHNPNPFASFSTRRPSPKPSGQGLRKRKASPSDDVESPDRMSASPSASPNISNRNLPSHTVQPVSRNIKRARTTVAGRPLPTSRLLETLDQNGLRAVLRALCERHPQLTAEIAAVAPKPTVANSLELLYSYENSLRATFPYGGNPEGDYAYNRVKQALLELLDALTDYTPHFLPPTETVISNSLEFLDGATDVIHRLPNWSNPIHNHHKNVAYEEISKAWTLVLKESAKKGGGITLQYDGWDSKLQRHNEQSGGRLENVINELRTFLGWMNNDANRSFQQTRAGNSLGFNIQTPGAPVPLQIW